ncbi:hypothetical protein A1O3_02026 [Capronia epimyces CBS 606.96]|uniref:Clr5 domain-containing protein n=1 Tax=Capronia epimyces CBS 606.96 TaxID=1182542 RepID=W9Y7Z3_9EURO|nr:uncharacterized protein A1O3_02026 [Capronia epimyces CBS 606.96]EXJ88962.1 hypothetical protein A1O3_02026 [Capronia epimyces CBS 606.96]
MTSKPSQEPTLLQWRALTVTRVYMWKLRLSQWDFRKNFSKNKELEEAAKEARRCFDQKLDPPQDLTLRGRSVPWDRVRRHFGDDPRYVCPWLKNVSDWSIAVGTVCLKASPADNNTELILKEVTVYWSSTITRQESLAMSKAKRYAAKIKTDPNDLRSQLLVGLGLIRRGWPQKGWQGINYVCTMIEKVFKVEEPDLLPEMLALLTARSATSSTYQGLIVEIARHFTSMAKVVLGPLHPLTTILTILTKVRRGGEVLEGLMELAVKVMMDVVEQSRDAVGIDRYHIYSLERKFIDQISDRLEPRETRSLIEKRLTYYKRTLGQRSLHTLLLVQRLAQLHEKEGSVDKAHEMRLGIIQLGERYPVDRLRYAVYFLTAEELAKYYFRTQQLDKALTYYCRAICWAADKMGKDHAYVSILIREFDALRRLQEDLFDAGQESASAPAPTDIHLEVRGGEETSASAARSLSSIEEIEQMEQTEEVEQMEAEGQCSAQTITEEEGRSPNNTLALAPQGFCAVEGMDNLQYANVGSADHARDLGLEQEFDTIDMDTINWPSPYQHMYT